MSANQQLKEPPSPGRWAALLLGVGCILAGLALNPFALPQFLPPGRTVPTEAVIVGQMSLLMAGGWLLWRRPRLAVVPGAVGALLSVGLAFAGLYGMQRAWAAAGEREGLLQDIDRSEDLALYLTARSLPGLEDLLLGRLLEGMAAELLAPLVRANGLVEAPAPAREATVGTVQVRQRPWARQAEMRDWPRAEWRPWRPFFLRSGSLEYAELHLEQGRFADPEETRYTAELTFAGGATTPAGALVHARARVQVLWVKTAPGQAWLDSAWLVQQWRTDDFRTTQADRPFFAEVLDQALPDSLARRALRTSLHRQLIVDSMRDPRFKKPHRHFTVHAFDRHPGLAVADVDGDGFEDIYIVARWGPNRLLHNQGDGTFVERATAFGLGIGDHSAAALFADFDNDGDQDLFLGRTLAPSQYLVNHNGRFVDRSAALVEGPLPGLVASLAAADYDGDGLLDLYCSTYAARMLLDQIEAPSSARAGLLDDFLSPPQSSRLWRLTRARLPRLVRDAPGPPNVLLKNMGDGRLGRVDNSPLAIWRNTLQASWGDYDNDGDADVYLANDFAPNNLLRNDGGGAFTDVTEPTGTADVGFGMGASWGDYDGDGRLDLYVTNMYSRAGRRITSGADAGPLQPLARGNSLWRNQTDRFARVSGPAPPALPVERGGWGWGGQFVDVDNDGWLDLYALSGFYTAPEEVAISEDT